ncbi:MAG: pyruvate kinase [Bacteroidales bacterium]|nr:pyruvate kinase [Bacteroidales bacterium]MCB9013666.1 pyruvate kinase [Bacteroidales bacterium]
MRNERSHTKVIATLGPASQEKDVLRQMFEEGIDVCRLNFSHGSHEDHLKNIQTIRELNQELDANVAILADLQGPKLRIGVVENNGVELVNGSSFKLVSEKCEGTAEKAYMSYELLPRDVKIGEIILIDDGKIKLEVTDTNRKDTVTTRVIYGGILSSKKGVNLPHTKVSLPSLTEKDKEDAIFALEHNVDWIALSFVRSVNDIIDLKALIKQSKKNTRIIAKIEKPEAINEIDQIIDMTDAIMVARGDLGVEVDFDRVPMLQKQIVEKCINQSKPVIIATQMMESMITNFRPTRAEATDVANAVLDGADTLMLSGETSTGKFPVGVINSMQKIIDWTEDNGFKYFRNHPPKEFTRTFLPDSICYNACAMAEQTQARAIITFTHSGYTAFRISSYRPKAGIFAFTMNKSLLPVLSLVWGVRAFESEQHQTMEAYINASLQFLLKKNLIKHGDVVVSVGSMPVLERGKTNMLKLNYI